MPVFRVCEGPRVPGLGKLTSVLQERCRRLSPRQYLPPIVGLEGGRGAEEMSGRGRQRAGPAPTSLRKVLGADLGLSQ